MLELIDLPAYLIRVNHPLPASRSLAELSTLIRHHLAAFPFENLYPLTGRVPELNLAGLQNKFLTQRRGGYCFEQNALFGAALSQLGFAVEGMIARVRLGVPEDVSSPRTHMVLRVTLKGQDYLTDVGFGALVPAAPVPMTGGAAVESDNGRFRLCAQEDKWLLQIWIDEAWRGLYRIDPGAAEPADYDMGNFCVATWKKGMFTTNLVLARLLDGERRTMFNTRFTRRRPGQPPERHTVTARADFTAVLREEFGLDPTEEELDAIMHTISEAGPAHPITAYF